MKKEILLIGIIFTGILFTGCLGTEDFTEPRRIDLQLQIDNVGDALISGVDTLEVEEFKFIVRQFNLIAEDSVIIQTDGLSSLVFAYTSQLQQVRLILSVDIGFADFDVFEGYHMFVDQVLDEDNVVDSDFFDDPENFSIVATGAINSEPFFYNSTAAFDTEYFFERVELGGVNETLVLTKRLDLEDVFVDPDTGVILDPLESGNREKIDDLFRRNLTVEAFRANRIPF